MFVRPEVEVVKFEAIDVIAASPEFEGGEVNEEGGIVLPDG